MEIRIWFSLFFYKTSFGFKNNSFVYYMATSGKKKNWKEFLDDSCESFIEHSNKLTTPDEDGNLPYIGLKKIKYLMEQQFKRTTDNLKQTISQLSASGEPTAWKYAILDIMSLQDAFGQCIICLAAELRLAEDGIERLEDEDAVLQKRIEAMENRIKELETTRSSSTQSLPLNKLYRGGTRRKKYKHNSTNKV